MEELGVATGEDGVVLEHGLRELRPHLLLEARALPWELLEGLREDLCCVRCLEPLHKDT